VRIVCFNPNGLMDANKRKMIVDSSMKGRVDVLGLSEMHLFGQGVVGSESGSGCGMWEGMKGGVVWAGLDEGYGGRGKEGCAILMSERVWKSVTGYGWKGARIVWVKCKIGLTKYAFVSVYAPVNVKTTKGKNERDKFWNELNECLREFEEGRKVVVMGDMNAKVGDVSIDEVVGKWGVPGRNENGDSLVELCAERGLFLANTYFEHKMIHRYTWRRGSLQNEQKGLIDFIAVDKRLKRDVTDAKVVRGMFERSDHLAVLMKMEVHERWMFRKQIREEKSRLALGKLNSEEARREYRQKVNEELSGISENIQNKKVEDVFRLFKERILGAVEQVVGTKVVKVRKQKGDAWWTDEVKEVVKQKREAYVKTLQRNVPEHVRDRRKREYMECKRRVKRVIEQSKMKVDENFGRKLSEMYKENKRLYWKEVQKERGSGWNNGGVEVKDNSGRMLRENDDVKRRWSEYFEELMNVNSQGKAIVTCMGMKEGGGRVYEQSDIKREEVVKAIGDLKCGKAPGIDGITAEMLKYGGEAISDWMHAMCILAWKEGRVPQDWTKATIVPVYKGKGDKSECGSYRGISLLSIPSKVYGKILIRRVQEITNGKVSEEQGGFRTGKGCVDQIFNMRMVIEKMLAKDKKVYAAFMDLEKAYDRVDWEAMWDVLKVYGVGGRLLSGVKAFYRDASACVKIKGEMSECFKIKAGMRQGCVMSPWLFNLFMDGVVREMKAKVGNVGVEMSIDKSKWKLNTILFADDTVLLAESEKDLQKLVNEFSTVCVRRKLKVNVSKSKVMVFERRKSEIIQFADQYRMRVESQKQCKIMMNEQIMEEVSEFKYLGSVLCKYGSMEGEIRERALQGRKVVGSLGRMMRERTVSKEIKKALRDSIIVPTVTYGSETWTWNKCQRSNIQAVEMSYLRGCCGVNRMDGESNENVYGRFGMASKGEGMSCGVVEMVKRSTLRWFGHLERMGESELTRRIYKSRIDVGSVRGRPPVKWEDRVLEYVREREDARVRGLEDVRMRCMDRCKWRLFCRGHPPEGVPRNRRQCR